MSILNELELHVFYMNFAAGFAQKVFTILDYNWGSVAFFGGLMFTFPHIFLVRQCNLSMQCMTIFVGSKCRVYDCGCAGEECRVFDSG